MKNIRLLFLILAITAVAAYIMAGCCSGSSMFGSNTPTAVFDSEKEFIVNGLVRGMANGVCRSIGWRKQPRISG